MNEHEALMLRRGDLVTLFVDRRSSNNGMMLLSEYKRGKGNGTNTRGTDWFAHGTVGIFSDIPSAQRSLIKKNVERGFRATIAFCVVRFGTKEYTAQIFHLKRCC